MGDNWKVFGFFPQFPQSEGTLVSKGRQAGRKGVGLRKAGKVRQARKVGRERS